MLRKAREEAAEIVRVTRRKTDEILHRLNRAEKENTPAEALVLGQEARQDLKRSRKKSNTHWTRRPERVSLELEEAREDRKCILKPALPWHNSQALSAGEIQVQAGTLRISTVLDDLINVKITKVSLGKPRVP